MTMARTPDEVFDEAIRQSPGSDRAAYLDEACGNDGELRGRVEQLLRAYDDAGSFLETPAAGRAATADRPSIAEGPGKVIGPYKLLQQIGEGGFGVVFLAEQEKPVRRRVALKVIKPGMDTREVIARFEAERQALAMMDHPNIAKVYDAGATENGRPYFVMELVQGVPITEYCDQCNLTTDERLQLFVSVCQAVQHAHQKGVIHRDIKPTNVLVAIQDGQPAPRIIDFGVAKAINQQLTEHTLMTAFAQMVGTPLYMSPEQAELSPLGIDTRSDIYSLGALLYELLTGTTPFDNARLKAASYDELRRIIREEEPPRPSARISTLAAELATTIAEHRRTDVRRLRQSARGELDWIVMKCLEKDRNRRYETPNSLARDIDRYLQDQPVQACPPSVAYRVKKLIRRNKVGVAAGSAVILALVGGLALATAGFVQARKQARISAAEAAKATAISELLQSALQSASPDQAKGPDYTVRQLLDDFSGSLADQLVGQRDVEADIRATIGNAYRRLRLFDLAAPQFEAALALRQRVSGTDDADYAGILVEYAQNLGEQRREVDAEHTVREAISIYRKAGISGRPLVKALWIRQLQLGMRIEFADNPADAGLAYAEEKALVEEALAIAEAEGTEYPELANMLHRHAPLMSKQGNHTEAEQWAQRAVDMHRRVHGSQHPETAYGLADLGRVLRDRNKYREAETAFRQALEIFRHYYGDDFSGGFADLRQELDRVISAQEGAASSEAEERAPEDTASTTEQPDDTSPANRSVRLAQEALERELRDAIRSFDKNSASSLDNASTRLNQAATYRQLAEIDLKQGKLDEAIQYFANSVAIASRLLEEEPTKSSFAEEGTHAQLSLAETLARANRMDECMTAFDVAIDMIEDDVANFSEEDWVRTLVMETGTRISSALLPCADQTAQNVIRTRRLLLRAVEGLEGVEKFRADNPSLSDYRHELASAYNALGVHLRQIGPKQAADAALRKAQELWQQSPNPSIKQARNLVEADPTNVHNWHRLGVELHKSGQWQEAVTAFDNCNNLGGSAWQWLYLSMAHQQLDNQSVARHWFYKSIDWMDEAQVEELREIQGRAAALIGLPDPGERSESASIHVRQGDAHRDLGEAEKAKAAYGQAIDLYKTLASDFPMVPAYNERLLDLLNKSDRHQEAAQVYHQAIMRLEKLPDDSELHIYRGTLYRDSGELDKAIADFSRAIKNDAQRAEVWELRGSCYLRKGQLEKVVEDYSEAIRLHPKNRWSWHERAYAHLMLGEHRKAIADHTTAIEIADTDAGQRLRRGRSYEMLEQFEKAEVDYSRAIELNPQYWENWYARSRLYAQRAQLDKARADLAMAVKLASINPRELNEMAWSLVTSREPTIQNLRTAVELAEKAVELSPQDGNIWNTLGVAEYRAGDWNKSIEALTRSMELRQGGDAYDYFFLAMSQWRLRHRNEARASYDKAVKWMRKNEPENTELHRFRTEAAELLGAAEPKSESVSASPKAVNSGNSATAKPYVVEP